MIFGIIWSSGTIFFILPSSAGRIDFNTANREGFPDPLPVERFRLRECPYSTHTQQHKLLQNLVLVIQMMKMMVVDNGHESRNLLYWVSNSLQMLVAILFIHVKFLTAIAHGKKLKISENCISESGQSCYCSHISMAHEVNLGRKVHLFLGTKILVACASTFNKEV